MLHTQAPTAPVSLFSKPCPPDLLTSLDVLQVVWQRGVHKVGEVDAGSAHLKEARQALAGVRKGPRMDG